MNSDLRQALLVGEADELGSGVRKMFKYGKSFAGTNPVLTEGDIFRDELELNLDLFNSGIIGAAETSGAARSKDVLTNDTANGGINGGIKRRNKKCHCG